MKEDEIKLIAYDLWEQENCPHAKDWEHWFRAEAIWEGQHKPKNVNVNETTKLATLEPNKIKSNRRRRS